MANRQIARDLDVAPSTIDRTLARLGRHCLLFHITSTTGHKPRGPLALDGFESFEYSQFFPFQHQVLVETENSFFWHFTDSPLRRKGRMTARQKHLRAEMEARLGRPDPRAIEKDVRDLLQTVLPDDRRVTLRSDDHRAYPRALTGLPCKVEHQITSSRARRDAHNPLFEINVLDLLIRHSQAGHRRETIAWPKRRQCSAERLALLLVWRNYIKLRWEKRIRATPAMLAGIQKRRLNPTDVLKQRLFPSRIPLPTRWNAYYRRAIRTVALPRNREHDLVYAF